jgi:hypothetical protein
MTYADFTRDLMEKGQPVEREVLEFIKKHYDECASIAEGKCVGYDILCPLKHTKIEVKNQNEAIKFVVIETSVNGKPTGISTSTSDYWVIKCKNNYHMMNTAVLKDLIAHRREKKYIIQGQIVKMKHLDIQDLIDNSIRIFFERRKDGNSI